MAIDWESVRAARVEASEAARRSDWDAREAAAVAEMRAQHARERQAEQFSRDCQAYAKFCTRQAEQERRNNQADRARDWEQAATNIGKGLWSVGRTIASEPAVSAYQHLRTELLYAGKTARLD